MELILCQISVTNHAIILFVYAEKFSHVTPSLYFRRFVSLRRRKLVSNANAVCDFGGCLSGHTNETVSIYFSQFYSNLFGTKRLIPVYIAFHHLIVIYLDRDNGHLTKSFL